MKSYVVISFNEDGDPPIIEEVDGAEMQKRLSENFWGDHPNFAEPSKKLDAASFAGLVIIEGKIVKPTPVNVVKEYRLN